MKLYYTKGACSLVVRIIINELGLQSNYESVDLKTKRTASGRDFLMINPKGAVPVLQTDDDEILTENAAILQYLADKQHVTPLLPAMGDFKRYRVIEWLNYIASDVHKSFGGMFNPTIPQATKESIFVPLIETKLSYVDQHLQANHYLLGQSFTLPDAYLFVMLSWAYSLKFDMNQWPALTRYFDELKERKSIQKSLIEEGLEKSSA